VVNDITTASDPIINGDDVPAIAEGVTVTAADVEVVVDVLSSATAIVRELSSTYTLHICFMCKLLIFILQTDVIGVPGIAGTATTGICKTSYILCIFRIWLYTHMNKSWPWSTVSGLGVLIRIFEGAGSGSGTNPSDPAPTKPPVTKTKPATTSTKSSSKSSSTTASATPYLLATKFGTAEKDFQNLVVSLGSPPSGKIIGYEGMPYQIWFAPLNDTMAAKAMKSTLVTSLNYNTMSNPTGDTSDAPDETVPTTFRKRRSKKQKRAPAPGQLYTKLEVPIQLAMLSDPDAQASSDPQDYAFRQATADSWVYVLDTGISSFTTSFVPEHIFPLLTLS
jgi:hypothetical protein